MSSPEQTGPIAVYGATGYTGRLVAAELRRRDADLVLAGRNAAKLEIVAEDLGGGVDTRVAALDDPAALRSLLERCAAVIACAGPFQRHGEAVLAAAVETATHYLDTTGEQLFMRVVFDDYGPRAAEAGVALVTAMGFDYAPGDMIAALTAEGMGALDEIVLAYDVRGFSATRGTMRSALAMLADEHFEWHEGELQKGGGGTGRGWFEFPELGRRRMIRYPAGEHITVPRHLQVRTVRTMLTAETLIPVGRLLSRLAPPVVLTPLQLSMRTPWRRALSLLVSRLPDGPNEESRRKSRFTIVCEARAGTRARRGTITGPDVYSLTARLTALGALKVAAPDYDRRGALAPSQAFDPRELLRSLRDFGVEFEVVPLPPVEE
jgi:short subunit dehydrogenase-like uncharacterized protein